MTMEESKTAIEDETRRSPAQYDRLAKAVGLEVVDMGYARAMVKNQAAVDIFDKIIAYAIDATEPATPPAPEPVAAKATDWDHRIIAGVSIALNGVVGLNDDVERLLAQTMHHPVQKQLHTLAEIAVAFIRWSQDLKRPPPSQAIAAQREADARTIGELQAEVRSLNLERDGPWTPTHQHRKGGLYRVVIRGLFEWDQSEAVVYDNADGHVWIRPASEFDDGRFAALAGTPATPATKVEACHED